MDRTLIVTVTSVAGRPQLALPEETTTDQVRDIVAERFGQYAPVDSWMRPHDFCGQLVPPPPPSSVDARQSTRQSSHLQSMPLHNRRGHLRGF